MSQTLTAVDAPAVSDADVSDKLAAEKPRFASAFVAYSNTEGDIVFPCSSSLKQIASNSDATTPVARPQRPSNDQVAWRKQNLRARCYNGSSHSGAAMH